MTINYQGRRLPLPAMLMTCPQCERAALQWNGHAWRCTHVVRRTDGTVKRCKGGIGLAAIFDVPDLEFQIHCGQPLSSFQLTGYALNLVRFGQLHLSWMTRTAAQRLYERLPVEDIEDNHDALEKLMRERQARRTVET